MATIYPLTTTLTEPCHINDAQISVADATGIQNPGSGTAYNQTPTYILVDHEWMEVDILYVTGETLVPVIRGSDGTTVAEHAVGATVTITDKTPDLTETPGFGWNA